MRDVISTLQSRWRNRSVNARRQLWDREYASGFGEQLNLPEEREHNLTLVEFMVNANKNNKILDVGCGEGLLLDSLEHWGYQRYVGIDFSNVALLNASKRATPQTSFVNGLAESFIPDHQFDSIVFNESLYYLQNPLQVIRRYDSYLTPDGAMLVSLFTKTERIQLLDAAIRKCFNIARSACVTNKKGTWNCCMLTLAS
jgi:2-polyprenyl-3-methyl-5-hydroxy-6-metoxy-1,4-benzoquinol methylase